MIIATCACGRRFQTQDQHAGKTTRCPACGEKLVVPVPGAGEGSAPEADKPTPPSWWYPQGRPEAPGDPARSGSLSGETRTRITPPRSAAPPTATKTPPGPRQNNRRFLIGSGIGGAALLLLGLLGWMGHSGPTGERGAEAGKIAGDRGLSGRVPGPDSGRPASGRLPDAEPPSSPLADVKSRPTPGGLASPPTSTPAMAGPPRLKLLVPAYFYPTGPGLKQWEQLIEAASRVPVVAVANPSSGPGDRRNPDYDAIVSRAARRGVTVVGYVGTNYGHRPLPEVEDDVDRWVEFYPKIGGIFFDAQASEPGQADYYVALRDHARGKIKGAFVINNPGTTCAEEYANRLDSVALCLFAAPAGFPEFRLPRWADRHPAERFGVMPSNIAGPEQMKDIIHVAPSRGFGLIYVTDARMPNLWDRLPGYWGAEVEAVRKVNSGQVP